MANREINIGLKAYDDLFKTDAERKAEEIIPVQISELKPFSEQPFKVLEDDSMTELVESIKENGVLSPIVVRPHHEGGYEILSGHRRRRACEIAGKLFLKYSQLCILTPVPNEKKRANLLSVPNCDEPSQRNDISNI